jgi:hypothetical protein
MPCGPPVKMPLRKLALLLLAVLLLPVTVYWLADGWLESSGGRQLLERTLSERIGMNVRLQGEFELMLLPDIGVAGTELVIGGPEPGSEFVRSREFEISVELRPLIDQQVLVEWIRISGGSLHPDRYKPSPSAAGTDSAAKFSLPEIQELSIRDFEIILPGEDEARLNVKELTINDFAENRETPFSLRIENLASIGGELFWDPGQSRVRFGNLRLDLEGQLVSGVACLSLGNPGSLDFDLQAGVFDLDAFREKLELPGVGGGAGADGLPLEIRGRFAAEELRTSGTVARGAVLGLGEEPLCK